MSIDKFLIPQKERVADYIARRAVEAGAKHVFLVTGGGAMHLNDAFGRNKLLSIVCFHHEQAAAMAAESYYRLTNRLAILNVTSGPGGINALNGVYGAYVDSIAILVVSGQVKRETFLRNYPIPLRQLGDQEVDIVSMVKPIVKYSTILQDPKQVRSVMDKAIFLSQCGRPGPVWVDVPVDVQGALINEAELESFNGNLGDLLSDDDITSNTKLEIINLLERDRFLYQIPHIIEKLRAARRPVIFAGMGIRLSGMHEQFLALIDLLKIPVVTGWNAHDILTNDSPYYAGRPGTVGDRAGNFTVQNADFLLILGSRLNIRQVSYNWKSFGSKAYKVMVDVDQAEIEKPTIDIDLKIISTLQNLIPSLIKKLKSYSPTQAHHDYLIWCLKRVVDYPTVLPEYFATTNPINPYAFIDRLFDGLDSDDIIVTGNGSACVMGFQAAKLKKGQRLYTNSGSASMGYELPAAIGASIATGQRRIICLAGDGSLMMNLQELQTLVGYGFPVKIIILNNGGYHSIRQTQEAYFPDNMVGIGPNDGVTFPDFVKLSKSFGIDAIKLVDLNDWQSPLIQNLLRTKMPAVIEVIVDPKQPFSPKLLSRKLNDGTMLSPSLEDMAPFLDAGEMDKNTSYS